MGDDYWSWRDRLAKANDPKFWPIEAIDSLVLSGQGQFWCDHETAAVSRFTQFPGGAVVCEVIALAGKIESVWRSISPAIENYARDLGAVRIAGLGRIGWERSSRPEGWRRDMVLIVKDLQNEG